MSDAAAEVAPAAASAPVETSNGDAPQVAEQNGATTTKQGDATQPAEDAQAEPKQGDGVVEDQSKDNDHKGAPSDSRKRKHDEGDWKERRDDFQRRRNRSGSRERRGGRGGGRNFTPRKQDYKIKSNFEDLPETDDPDEIRKQVEFYFSDSNLYADKFLLSQVGGSENKAVPIKVIHSFKRMRRFQPYTAVVAALKDSEFLNINEQEEIQRKEPLPEGVSTEDLDANLNIMEDKTRSRSIYAKGFGEETKSTHLDIEAFFAPYGPINAIRLRRFYPDKSFKGSVFVEFDSDETAKQFLELEDKPKWNDKDLKVMSKEEYVKSKARDVRDGKIPSSDWRGSSSGGRGRGGRGRGGDRGGGRGRGRGGRDGRDRDNRDDKNWRERRDNDRRTRRQSPDYKKGTKGEDAGQEKADAKTEKTEDAKAAAPVEAAAAETKAPAEESKKRKADAEGEGDAAEEKESKKAKVEDIDAEA